MLLYSVCWIMILPMSRILPTTEMSMVSVGHSGGRRILRRLLVLIWPLISYISYVWRHLQVILCLSTIYAIIVYSCWRSLFVVQNSYVDC